MLRNITLLVSMAMAMALHAQSPTVRGYEYWFDQNDANRIFEAVAPATTVNLTNVPLDTDALSVGTHIVHLRLKDHASNGAVRWSSVVTRTFEIFHNGPWEIVAVRYWVGTPTNEFDPLVRTKYFDTPQQQINYADSPLDLCGYPTGNQTLKLQLKDNHGQWSSVVSRTVNVETAGTLGLPVIAASPAQNSFCPGSVVTFTATPPSGPNIALPGSYTWTVPTGAGWSHVPSTGSTITVTVGSSAGTVQIFSTNACGTSATASLAMNISQVPEQPTPIQGAACAGSPASFSVTSVPGVTFQWSVPGGTPSTGSGESFSTTLTANATITVTPVNSCGVYGPERTAPITVSQPLNAGTNGNLSTCSGTAPQSLIAQLGGNPSAGGTWSGPSPITNGEYNPATMNPGVYSYTVAGVGACPNAIATVTVVENQEPNAGTNGTLSACSNGDPILLSEQLAGNPQVGGNWSGPSPTTGSYNPVTMDPGVYTYTVNGIAPCANASATVTVSETDAPNAGENASLVLCAEADPVDLLTVLNGTPDPDGAWTGPSVLGTSFFDPAVALEGDYSYTVAGTGACSNDSATVSVNVLDLELDMIDGPTSVGELGTLLFTATPELLDADSVVWIIPAGWNWAGTDSDTLDTMAYLDPPDEAGFYTICAYAIGGGCVGDTVCFETQLTVGVRQLDRESSSVSIYPNPNNGQFTISMNGSPTTGRVMILDALGKQVLEQRMISGTSTMQMDLGDLAAGVYHVRIETEREVVSLPVVVRR